MNKKEYIIKYIKTIFVFIYKKQFLRNNRISGKIWKHKFLQLLKSNDPRYDELLKEFFNCRMKKVSHNKVRRKNINAPILFCVVKNDRKKIEKFMEHYRKLGIECFIFLDNVSSDGTQEYLCRQKDVIVYESAQEYSSARRVAWLNRLLAIYGQNQWCMIVDSDELVTYIGCEKHTITEVVQKAIEKGYCRIEGLMVDMYPSNRMFAEKGIDYIRQYRFFDKDTYCIQNRKRGLEILGGPRKRVFKVNAMLSKYPLFYFREQDFVASSHYMIPTEPIRKCPIWLAICHYKFIDENDLKKINEAVKKENYASGSADYKKYQSVIRNVENLFFYEEGISCEMVNSDSLNGIQVLKAIF